MARTEASFKTEFKDSLTRFYGDEIFMWSPSDKFRAGISDLQISCRGGLLAVEFKFIKEIPKRETTNVLIHEVSTPQIMFIKNLRRTGNNGVIIIGTPDVAVVFSDLKNNYTLSEVRAAPRIEKRGGVWQVQNFYEEWYAKR